MPIVQPEEAIRFFRDKGYQIGFAWQDVWQGEHAHQFTVAKAMSRDLLEDIRADVDRALAEGLTLEQFRAELRPKLEARGWWGKKRMIDPLTGENRQVQLGSPRRLKIIFQVNMRTAYMAGKWERIQRTKKAFPFLRYVSVKDGRERPEHGAWHGTIKPVDDPWWDTHFPPCGWNCRCTVQAINQRAMDREGWSETDKPASFKPTDYVNRRTGEVSKVPGGIDPGWAYNVGKAKLGPAPVPPAPRGLVPATPAHVKAFLEPFGLKPGESTEVKDQGGHPQTISEGWFRGVGGQLVLPAKLSVADIAQMAQTIRGGRALWRWVAAQDGRQLLMRRFVSSSSSGLAAARVDVGAIGWRVQLGEKTAEAIDPPSRSLNDFTRIATALKHPIETFQLGPISKRAAAAIVKLGFEALARKKKVLKPVTLEAQRVRHLLQRHGGDHRGQVAIGLDDLKALPRILDRSEYSKTKGAGRLFFRGTLDGFVYEGAVEIRGKAIAFISMRKRAVK